MLALFLVFLMKYICCLFLFFQRLIICLKINKFQVHVVSRKDPVSGHCDFIDFTYPYLFCSRCLHRIWKRWVLISRILSDVNWTCLNRQFFIVVLSLAFGCPIKLYYFEVGSLAATALRACGRNLLSFIHYNSWLLFHL